MRLKERYTCARAQSNWLRDKTYCSANSELRISSIELNLGFRIVWNYSYAWVYSTRVCTTSHQRRYRGDSKNALSILMGWSLLYFATQGRENETNSANRCHIPRSTSYNSRICWSWSNIWSSGGRLSPTTSATKSLVGQHIPYSTLPDPRLVISRSKWMSWGWTYQEAMLSRRRIIFTDNQVYFECQAMQCREAFPPTLELLHTNNKQNFRDDLHPSLFQSTRPVEGYVRPWRL